MDPPIKSTQYEENKQDRDMQGPEVQTLNVNQDLQHQEQPHKLSNQLDDEMKSPVTDSQKKDEDKQGSESDDGDANDAFGRLKKKQSQNQKAQQFQGNQVAGENNLQEQIQNQQERISESIIEIQNDQGASVFINGVFLNQQKYDYSEVLDFLKSTKSYLSELFQKIYCYINKYSLKLVLVQIAEPEKQEKFSSKRLFPLIQERLFCPGAVLKVADYGNKLFRNSPRVQQDDKAQNNLTKFGSYTLAELTKKQTLIDLLKYFKMFTEYIREEAGSIKFFGNQKKSSNDPCFYLSEMCDEMVEYFTDKCDPAEVAKVNIGVPVSKMFSLYSEICHILCELQDLISFLDKKIELLQEHLIGLKAQTPYEQLLAQGLRPDYDNQFWYAWARFIEQFRGQATDPLGKSEGLFLSPTNKQHVVNFRSLGTDEYTKMQSLFFKTVYSSNKEISALQANPYPDQNPFDYKKSEFSSINKFKMLFQEQLSKLWAEENGFPTISQLRKTLQAQSPQQQNELNQIMEHGQIQEHKDAKKKKEKSKKDKEKKKKKDRQKEFENDKNFFQLQQLQGDGEFLLEENDRIVFPDLRNASENDQQLFQSVWVLLSEDGQLEFLQRYGKVKTQDRIQNFQKVLPQPCDYEIDFFDPEVVAVLNDLEAKILHMQQIQHSLQNPQNQFGRVYEGLNIVTGSADTDEQQAILNSLNLQNEVRDQEIKARLGLQMNGVGQKQEDDKMDVIGTNQQSQQQQNVEGQATEMAKGVDGSQVHHQ